MGPGISEFLLKSDTYVKLLYTSLHQNAREERKILGLVRANSQTVAYGLRTKHSSVFAGHLNGRSYRGQYAAKRIGEREPGYFRYRGKR